MNTLIFVLDIVGTISFAISGAMTAMQKNMDIFGVCMLGVTTAVGGGILGYCLVYGGGMWLLGLNDYEKNLVAKPLRKLLKKGA